MTMRRNYTKMTCTAMMIEAESPIMAASVTSVRIKVNNVTVEEFSAGFSEGLANNDFKDISFD